MGIFLVLIVLAIFVALFLIIARKGRALRGQQPLPPAATKASLQWMENGEQKRLDVVTPFYLGKSSESNIVLPDARAKFEACIFYHHQRFAFQSLDGAGEILVNEQETIAGYLADGDTLVVGKREFIFHCS